MTRTTTPATDAESIRRNFAIWLRAAMTLKYGPRFKNVQLARDTENMPDPVREQTVSRWLKGEVTPTPRLLISAVRALGVDRDEAFMVAGITPADDEAHETSRAARLRPHPEPAAAGWSAWIIEASRDTSYDVAGTDPQIGHAWNEVSNGIITGRTIARWRTGKRAATEAEAAFAARVLRRDPVEAATVAGHLELAALIRAGRRIRDEGDPTVREIMALDIEPEVQRHLIEDYWGDVERGTAQARERLSLRARDAARASGDDAVETARSLIARRGDA